MSLVKVAVLGISVLAAGGCATPHQEKAGAHTSGNIAAEVTRICALPAAERETALEKLKKDSGMVLFCGSKE